MCKSKIGLIITFIFVLSLVGIGLYRTALRSPPSLLDEQYVTMGTRLTITTYPDNKRTRRAVTRAYGEVERINDQFSTYRERSLTSRVNDSAPRAVEVTPEFIELVRRAKKLYRLTDRQFDITVGPLVELWGFYRHEKQFPAETRIDSALRRVGLDKVRLHGNTVRLAKAGMKLDFGALAKGYAVDRAARILADSGCENFLVNLGGNLRARGLNSNGEPWKVGLKDPRNSDRFNGRITLADGAVATSGDYERMFKHKGKRYAHIINPRSGYPVQGRATVTVIARDALTADLYSTAIFLTGLRDYYQKNERVLGVLVGQAKGSGLKYQLTPGFEEKLVGSPEFDYSLVQ